MLDYQYIDIMRYNLKKGLMMAKKKSTAVKRKPQKLVGGHRDPKKSKKRK